MEYLFFNWDNVYNIDHYLVDEQHHQLLMMINQLLEIAVIDLRIDQQKFKKLYQELIDYSIYHFKTEEEIMVENKLYAEYIDLHQQEHQAYINFILSRQKDEVTIQDIFAVADYLVRWFVLHVINVDKWMAYQIEFIKENDDPTTAYQKAKNINQDVVDPLLNALKTLYNILLTKNMEIIKQNNELEEKVQLRTKELERLNQQLRENSLHDQLTSLPNRRYAMEKLHELYDLWKKEEQCFSLLFIDLDEFKLVNDLYGHDSGDKILKWAAHLLQTTIRANNIVCRLGGDEFIVICPLSNLNYAKKLKAEIENAVKQTVFPEYPCWHPALSIGIAKISQQHHTIDDLLKEADQAMYQIKMSKEKVSRI